MSHCPCASRIRAPAGIGHSPAPPAHTIRPARTSVTALVTIGRPVPSHRFALTMARVGFGGGAKRGWGGRPPQAPSINVPRKTAEETTDERNFICALLAPAATRRTTPRGASLTSTTSRCGERMRLAVTGRRVLAVIRNTTPELSNHHLCVGLHSRMATAASGLSYLSPPDR